MYENIKKSNTKYMKKTGYYIVSLFFLVVVIRLMFIWDNSYAYQEKLQEKTNIYVYGNSAPRGRILDVNGNVLVDNRGIKNIYYNKIKNISITKEIEIAKELANILDIKEASTLELKRYYLLLNSNGKDLITKEEYDNYNARRITKDELLQLKLSRVTDSMLDGIDKKEAHIYFLMNDGYNYQKKLIMENASEEEYAKVIESNISGVTGEIYWERIYLYGETLRNIFGSVGKIPKDKKDIYLNNNYELTDYVGVSYLEYQYEDYLKGSKAKYLVNSDYTLTLIEEEKRGNDLVLSVDIELQKEVENILKRKILDGKKYSNTEYYQDSYAIVSNPLNGEIMALAGMRLNKDGTWSDISLNNINKSFTIGSAVKGATIAVGYQNNLIDSNKYITDSCVKLYLVPEKCSFKRLGRINDLKALAYSSNYYQYLIAIGLTGATYKYNMKLDVTENHFNIYRDMLGSFGLGVLTNIDLPNEKNGIIGSIVAPDLLLNLSIGQYDTYTPIQVLQYINSVASSKRIAPSIMKRIVNNSDVILEHEKNILNDVLVEQKYLERIKEGMKLVLKEGTGRIYVPYGFDAAGKTGTSESFLDTDNDGRVDTATITSTFAGFFPTDNPRYSIVVITPNISHRNGSSDGMYYGASKITKDIIEYITKTY